MQWHNFRSNKSNSKIRRCQKIDWPWVQTRLVIVPGIGGDIRAENQARRNGHVIDVRLLIVFTGRLTPSARLGDVDSIRLVN